MTETELQELFIRYQGDRDNPAVYQEVLEKLHTHIYRYAKRRFESSDDQASEFYIYVFERIEKILRNYDPGYGISFFIYLSVKLRSYYKDFIEKEKRNLQNAMESPEEAWKIELFYSDQERKNSETESQDHVLLKRAMDYLPLKENVIIRLYYGFPLNVRQFRYLLQIHGMAAFGIYRDYLKKCRKKYGGAVKKKKAILERINYLNTKILLLPNKEKYPLRRARLQKKFFSLTPPVSMRLVGSMVGESASMVSRRVKKAIDTMRKSYIQMTKDYVD